MTLSYPRSMPARGARSSYMELQRIDYASPEVGGGGGAVTAGAPRWSGRWSLVDGARGVAVEWRAFVASLRGSQKLFIGRDLDRPWPVYYRGGLPSGWSGAAATWARAVTADGQAILSLTGLPGGMGVGAGDYVDLRWSTGGQERRFLVRAIEEVASTGGRADFAIEPAIPDLVPQNAVAHMDRCGCLMRLDTTTTQIAETDMTRQSPGSSVIAGLQVILP